MKVPWPLYLAWKQLFPTQRKMSFFSLLSVIGVALGVNVMIVVIAFMQGFQQKFRNDIINNQGHAKIVPLARHANWKEIPARMLDTEGVKAVTPFLHAHLLLQSGNYHSIPFAIGLHPDDGDGVLPIGAFLEKGMTRFRADDGEDVTPLPTIDTLEDEVVFLSSQTANRLGVRPAAVVQLFEGNASLPDSTNKGGITVSRLDPYVESAEWEILFNDQEACVVRESISGDEFTWELEKGPLDLGFGYPVFEVSEGGKPFVSGDRFLFQVFKASKIEIFSPNMIEQAKADEMVPPREARVGGIFEMPSQGFQMEALIGTMRFMEDMRGEEGICDGFYLKFSDSVARNEGKLRAKCRELELLLEEDWAVIPWSVENAWFFELLQFEETLMVVIMVPIGLVAAFAIAIALMTTVLRKIREIGLLVAMGGRSLSVGMVFCLQGFIIGTIGATVGCGLAILFIRYRDALMTMIVELIVGQEGQVGVSQFYDFQSLDVPYPWESPESMSTFLVFALFAIVVSTIAGLLPAWRATMLKPADALRSE
jgi:ABC-type lipoprotein release transport system permease subunit